jgi:cytochrome c peroxidase
VGGTSASGQVTLSPDEVRAALAAYMARIPPEPSPFVAPGRGALTREERRGLTLFRDRCAGCHELVGDTTRGNVVPARALERRLLAGQVALTSARLYDVGTPVLGKSGNNPPSLRGAWEAAPYFSDGSARTLEEVLRRTDPSAEKVHAPANAERPPAWSAGERAALLAFLRAL